MRLPVFVCRFGACGCSRSDASGATDAGGHADDAGRAISDDRDSDHDR
jgi:hypothetical protein